MPGLLADHNIAGLLLGIEELFSSGPWAELWIGSEIKVYTFADLKLSERATDLEVWEVCRSLGLLLVTGNRNAQSPESLDAVIRSRSDLESLPVLTIGDTDRLARDRLYAQLVGIRLIEIVMDLDLYRGTGRLFVP